MSTEKRSSRGNSSRRQKSLLDIWSRAEPSRAGPGPGGGGPQEAPRDELRELRPGENICPPSRERCPRARERSVERSGGHIYFGDSLSTRV